MAVGLTAGGTPSSSVQTSGQDLAGNVRAMRTTGAIGPAALFAVLLCTGVSGCEREPHRGEVETPVSVPGLTSTRVDVPPRSTAP